MHINFNNDQANNGRHDVSNMQVSDYAAMVKQRKQDLPDIQQSIQEALEDYEGQSIAIVIVKEDENGLPTGHHVVMAGVSRMECQIDLSQALSQASDTAMDVLLESTHGDVRLLTQVASAITNHAKKVRGKKED